MGLDPHTVQPAPEAPPPLVGGGGAAQEEGEAWGQESLLDADDEEEEDGGAAGEEDEDGFAAVRGAKQPPPQPPAPGPAGPSPSSGSINNNQRRPSPVPPSSSSSLATAPAPEDPYVPSDAYLRSVQCRAPQLMQARDLDPSLALGFYCRNEADFEAFCRHARALRKELARRGGLPAPFVVEQSPPEYEGSAMVSSLAGEGEEEEDDDEGEGKGADGGEESDVEDEYVIVL